MTSLQKNADDVQRWPFINLIRQILHIYGYRMEPFRKADGYTKSGTKKYRRFFLICKNFFFLIFKKTSSSNPRNQVANIKPLD